jgi:hypothetical protein
MPRCIPAKQKISRKDDSKLKVRDHHFLGHLTDTTVCSFPMTIDNRRRSRAWRTRRSNCHPTRRPRCPRPRISFRNRRSLFSLSQPSQLISQHGLGGSRNPNPPKQQPCAPNLGHAHCPLTICHKAQASKHAQLERESHLLYELP